MLRHAFSVAVLAALVVLAVIPADQVERWPTLCMWRNLAGMRCLGCGGTHAIMAILRGHVIEAFRQNAIAVLLTAWIAAEAVHDLTRAWVHRVWWR